MKHKKMIFTVSLLLLAAGVAGIGYRHEEISIQFQRATGWYPISALIAGHNARANYQIGNYYFGGGAYNLAKALVFYNRAISFDGNYQPAYYQRSRVYFLLGKFFPALQDVNQSIALAPDYAPNYYLRGLIHGYNNQLSESETDFQEFIRRSPDQWAGYNDLAWIYFEQGKYREIKDLLADELTRQQNAWLFNSLGVALMNLGEYDGARNALLEAQKRASYMSPRDWGGAYPGNDPQIYPAGLKEMKESIVRNLEIIEERRAK